MVVRTWSARSTAEGAKKYITHFRRKVLPQLQRISGYQGVLLLRRRGGDEAEVQVLTFWDSMASVRQFAGTDPDRAVVDDEARAVLQDFDSRVAHFEIVLDTRNSSRV